MIYKQQLKTKLSNELKEARKDLDNILNQLAKLRNHCERVSETSKEWKRKRNRSQRNDSKPFLIKGRPTGKPRHNPNARTPNKSYPRHL